MEYLLGIDIGTSACKAALFDEDGNAVATSSHEYPVFYPHPGWAEQEPDDWWNAAVAGIRDCLSLSGVAPADIAGVGIDGQSWSAVPVDRDGAVLCRSPIWQDTRSVAICDRLNREIGAREILALSGNPLTAPYATGKVVWFRENRPDIYGKIYRILQSNSYIVYRLTGVLSQDVSQAYAFHCFDIKKRTWDADMANRLGIPLDFLPPPVPSQTVVGTVTKEAAALCGLSEGTPVVAGTLDSSAATLGAGILRSGDTQEQGGTSGGMSICADNFTPDPRLIVCPYFEEDKWLLQGGTTGGGGVLRWMAREFAAGDSATAEKEGKNIFARFDEMAEKIPAGSDGLVFLPYLAGERTPIWDPLAKGVFYGMDYTKTKGHFLRAAMEGVGFSLWHNLETAQDMGARIERLFATGGCANSRLWTQMKADMTGLPIDVTGSDNATNLGAALLAGVGVGVYSSFREAVTKTVRVKRTHIPDPAVKEAYDRNFGIYLELYDRLKDLMHR